MLKAVVVIAAVLCLVEAQPLIQKQKLRIKLSARGLPDKDNLGTTDPYVIVYYTENGSDKEREVSGGRTATLTDNENPTWGDIIEFDYDRSRGQRWHFKVYDHDNAREDDTVGKAWVIVDDYVDKGQIYTANLHKKGTLTIQSADPVVVTPQVQPVPSVQPSVQPAVQPAVQPVPVVHGQHVAPVVAPQPQRLRVQLAARGLPDLDIIGTVDPYVKAYYTDDKRASETQFGRTAPISDNENPDFKEVLEFDYVKGTHQRWHFVLLDQDDNRRDDEAGEAFLDVDEYVTKGENIVLPLKKGQLIVKRA